MLWIAALGTGTYMAVFVLQRLLVFPHWAVPHLGLPGNFPKRTRKVCIATSAGETEALYLANASTSASSKPLPLLVFFHANAETAMENTGELDELYNTSGVNLLVMEYRGYGTSDGYPSQEAIVADSVKLLDLVLQQPEVTNDVILHGRSIGGAIAAQVGLRRPSCVKGIILESTFTNLYPMFRSILPFWIPSFLVRDPLHTLEALQLGKIPSLVIHGQQDEVPVFMSCNWNQLLT